MKKAALSIIFLIIFILGLFYFLGQKKEDLEGFYKLTLEDPLFYSSFFEAEEFERGIKELKESEDQLKKVIIENLEASSDKRKEEYTSIFKEGQLFPYQFLGNLSLINQATKDFLLNPSVKLGQELLELYDQAADSYLQDISSKIKIFETLESYRITQPYFFFVDSVSSFEVAKNDFLTLKENGDKLKGEITKRRNCLLGNEDCQALVKIKDNTSFIELMEGGEFNLEGEKIDFIRNSPPPSFQIIEVGGPYKIKSFCWQNSDFEHWMHLIYHKEDGKTLVMPKLANQNYYLEVRPELENPIDKALSEKGIKFYLQLEGATYECQDLTFYPQLLTLDFLKEQIEKGLITKEDLEKKLDYKLLIENQFGLIVPVMNTISYHLEVLKLAQMIIGWTVPPEFLFSTRTAYSIFYFPFAKSIWRIDEQLKYFVPEKEKPLRGGQKVVTLDELEKLGYTKEEIKKFHIDQREFFYSLLQKQY